MDWLRKLVGKEGPLKVSFQDLKQEGFSQDTPLESICITAGGDFTPANCAAMGVKLTRGDYLLVQPYRNTVTYQNLSQFPFATVNFTTNPLTFAVCALKGENAGPHAPESSMEELIQWKDFPVPSLKSAFLSLKCMRETMDDVNIGQRGMFLLSVKEAAILTPTLPLTNRADNLALEAVVHATRVKIFTEQENFSLAKDLLATIKRYETYIKANAPENSPAYEAIERVNTFLQPYLSRIT